MQLCLNPGKIKIDLPFEEAAALAAKVGYTGLEFPIEPGADSSAVRAVYEKYNLTPGGQSLGKDWRGTEAEHAASLEHLKAFLPIASAVGSKTFIAWIPSWSDELPYGENFKYHVARFKPIVDLLAEHDCNLALEWIGPQSMRVGHKYNFIYTVEQTLELCDALGPNAGVLMDSWHWHCSLGTVESIASMDVSRVNYVHVNDAPAGTPQEHYIDQQRALPTETGEIDLGGFIESLKAIGYDGPVVAEPFDSTLADLSPEESASRTFACLEKMMRVSPKPRLPEMMQVVAIGDSKAVLEQRPVPRPRGNEVVVKLHAAMICGSNLGSFHAEGGKSIGGHEGSGEVVAVANSSLLKVGDRVGLNPLTACGKCHHCRTGNVIVCKHRPTFDGHFAQYTRVADVMCTVLPVDISYEHGALLGCGLGPAYAGLKFVEARAFDTVMITGLGPVGLGATALATYMNINVIAIDMEEYRMGVAKKLGAQHVLSPKDEDFEDKLREALGSRGHLKGLDCSGSAIAQRMHIDRAAPLARIAFIGENKGEIPLSPSHDMIRKQLHLTGIWHMNVHDQPDLITFLRRAPEKADQLVTHCFPFSQGAEAFKQFESREAVKVVLQPWE